MSSPVFCNASRMNQLRDISQERLGALVFWIANNLFSRTLFHNNAAIHKCYAICYISSKRHFVRYDNHSHMLIS